MSWYEVFDEPMELWECRSGGRIIAEDEEVEFCRVCSGDLCLSCWNEHDGDCGHGGEKTEEVALQEDPWPACTRCGSTDTERVDVGREGRHLCGECGGIFWSQPGKEVLTC